MGSKERVQRWKDNRRTGILDAALGIVKKEGWQALSMRKIADEIEYSAPNIYGYFSGKESLVEELTRIGYLMLAARIRTARDSKATVEGQLEAMWMTYWAFSLAETELYRAMYGVEMYCSKQHEPGASDEVVAALFIPVIRRLLPAGSGNDIVAAHYVVFWSMVHGIVAINILQKGKSQSDNEKVLSNAIQTMISRLKY